MIPNTFDYARAGSVSEAVSLLQQHGDDAKLLAGGHSLIPAMKLRLSAPALLIDVTGIDALKEISASDGRLHLGALVTHRQVEHSDVVRAKCRVLSQAAALIGDPQVRNRGTIGGSLAHADPSADYPALVLALNAQIEATGPNGSRTIAGEDFFTGLFETALEEGEVITKVSFPVLGEGEAAAYQKFANAASRYALVGVAAWVKMSGGTAEAVRLGVTGAAPSAFRATSAEQALQGGPLDEDTIADAVRDLADPNELMSDLGGSASYRAHLCEVMAKRALLKAAKHAG